MALNKEKQRHLTNLYTIAQKYPGKKTTVLTKLEDYGLTIEDFNDYDSLMVSQNVVESSSVVDEYPEIPGFTQSDKYSDSEVLKIFESRDALQGSLDEIGSPPTDAEWFQAGVTAEQRISKLRPFYERRKAEEWEELESALPGLGTLTAPIGFLTELFTGAADLRYDFKEDLHERGAFTSLNPLTGFGAWDIAEFKKNPRTGQAGFSPELIAIEDELEKLYGDKRGFMENVEEGGYAETLPGSTTKTELDRLNTMITEEQLLDPRMFGEAQ
jgi:hypothetical protein